MGRFWKCSIILLALILCGCRHKPQAAVSHLVTGVDIFCQEEDVQITRHYTHSPNMEYVLLYLRLLRPLGKPEQDPTNLPDPVFHITVSHADGSRVIYRQKAHRYLSINGSPWQIIDPGQATGLYQIMQKIPSDSL